jgi:anti-sigma factor RsiW
MEHELVAAQNMTERYLLNELDPTARDEFEEHYFNCAACAADVQAASLLVEKIKDGAIADPERRASLAAAPIPIGSAWHGWLRPALVIPVMAVLLMVVGYQNLVTYPHLAHQLNSPQILPYAQVNLDTYASEGPTITPQPGQAFLLLVRIPPR